MTIKKDAEHKTQWMLLPWGAVEEVVHVWQRAIDMGKYRANDWKLAHTPNLFVEAAIRHIASHCRGGSADPESGQTHMAHAACNLLMVVELDRQIAEKKLRTAADVRGSNGPKEEPSDHELRTLRGKSATPFRPPAYERGPK